MSKEIRNKIFNLIEGIDSVGSSYWTYFVDQVNGSDTNDGTTPGLAWKTINKVNISSFVAGDGIGLKAGDTWKETLTVPSNGEEGNPILFGKYGSGAKPILNGSDVITGWTPENITGTSLAVDANLQGYFKFDNDWNDSSGKGNHLTIAGGAPSFENTDVIQGTHAANFVAATSDVCQRVDTSLSANFPGKVGSTNTDMTIGCRVKFNSILLSQGIISKGYQSNGYVLSLNANQKLSFKIKLDGVSQLGIISNNIIGKDIWYSAIARVDSVNKIVNIFINGIKQAAHYDATTVVIPATSGSAFRFGFEAGQQYLNSKADELFVLNKALTDAEIFGVYAHGVDGTRNVYTAYYKDGLTYPGYAFENGIAMLESGPDHKDSPTTDVELSKQIMPQMGLWWDDTVGSERLYIRCSGDADPATKTIEVSQRDVCLQDHKDYITIQDIQCEKGTIYGISTLGIGNVIQRNTLVNIRAYGHNYSQGGGQGIVNMGGNGTVITGNDVSICDWGINNSVFDNTIGIHVYDNDVHNIGADGICILASTVGKTYANVLIELNRVHDVGSFRDGGVGIIWTGASGGILGDAAGTNNIARYNIVYNNGLYDQGYGIGIQGIPASSIKVYYNLMYGMYGACIMIVGGSGHLIYNNTCHGRTGKLYGNTGIQLSSGAANCLIKNNIFYASEGVTIFQALAGAVTGHVIDYNTYYGGGATPFYWAGNKSFAAYKTASSQDAHSVNNDPLFTNLVGLNFTLQSVSPCKNTGVDVNLIRDILGSPIVGVPDMGCYEKQ